MDRAAKQRVQQNHRNQLKLQHNSKSAKRHHEEEEQNHLKLIASASPASSSSVVVTSAALTRILIPQSSLTLPSQSQKKRCIEHVSTVTSSTLYASHSMFKSSSTSSSPYVTDPLSTKRRRSMNKMNAPSQ